MSIALICTSYNSTGEQRNSEGTDEKTADGAERYVETFLSLLFLEVTFALRSFLSGCLILERPEHYDTVPLELKHRIYIACYASDYRIVRVHCKEI